MPRCTEVKLLTVAFAVGPGEVLGVLGPNGSGKSTLLSALAGLIPLTGGRIELAGQVMDDTEHRRVRRGCRAPGRLRVPKLPAVPAPERARQRCILTPRPRPGTQRLEDTGPPLARSTRPHPTRRAQARSTVRWASPTSGVSAPSPATPRYFSSTSPLLRWTHEPASTFKPNSDNTSPTSPDRACWSLTTHSKHSYWLTGYSCSNTGESSRKVAQHRWLANPPPNTSPNSLA